MGSVDPGFGTAYLARVVGEKKARELWYLCRRYTDASLKDIGRAFNRDHTSVMYAVDVVERRILERPQLRYELEALLKRL